MLSPTQLHLLLECLHPLWFQSSDIADPPSIAASVASLITITESVLGKGYQYVKEAKDAVSQVAALLSEITNLFGVLHSLQLAACRFEGEEFDSTMQIHRIHTCYAILKRYNCTLIRPTQDRMLFTLLLAVDVIISYK